MNNKKRDKIPNPALIENRRELITHYWELIARHKQRRFGRELKVALLGYEATSEWQEPAIAQLKQSCDYLISTRGFESWDGSINGIFSSHRE